MLSKPIHPGLPWLERLAREHIVTQGINDSSLLGKDIRWDILRTDLIHPICSGNKFFKLKYYLQDALLKKHTRITTFGGPWSNHIVATAFAAEYCGLKSVGIIRGEQPPQLSSTLLQAMEEGMELKYLSRQAFSETAMSQGADPNEYIIPQGGCGPLGVEGAAEILQYAKEEKYTHICCACGTGTMLAGLISSYTGAHRKTAQIPVFVGIPVLNDPGIRDTVEKLTAPSEISWELIYDFHFGGYAKKTAGLISFMNRFYEQHSIPTDFVYTGKLMFGISELISKGYFPWGSRILAIHSGGLQGNKSLKKGALIY